MAEDQWGGLTDTPQTSNSQRKRKRSEDWDEPPVKRKAHHKKGLTTGELDAGIEDFIKDNYVNLSKMLDVKPVIPYLIQDRVLTTIDRQRILNKETEQDKAEELMGTLSVSGKCTPKQFIDVLQMTNQTGLIDSLSVDGLENKYQATIKAPEGLEAVETKNTSVKLRWNPVSSDQLPVGYQLLGYRLEQRTVALGSQKLWASALGRRKVLEPTIVDFTVVDLTPYEDYLICVRSAALQQEREMFGKRSVPIHVVTREQHQPYPPRSVRLDDTHGSLILTWKEPSPATDVRPEFLQYVIEMCLYVEGKSLREWTECCKTTQCKFLIKEHEKWTINVERSGHCRFRVSANNYNSIMEKVVSSLPQEMGDPEIHIRIEAPWSMKKLFDAAVEALWHFSGTYARREHGSIIFVISCHDVISLRELWMNYRLGKVKKFFQNLLSRDRRTRPAFMATDAELVIKIEERDFYSCRRHLLLTRPTDQGFRVAGLGDAESKGTQLGLSEDYPVYCKPTSHRTTCPRLDFLDPAVSTKAAREQTQATVFDSVTKETANLRKKNEEAQKSLQKLQEENQQLQVANKSMTATIEELLYEKHTAKGPRQGQGYGRGDPAEEKDSTSGKSIRLSLPKASSKATKVLLVSQEYSTSKGGISTINLNAARKLTAAGAEVYATVLEASQQDERDAERDGVRLLKPRLDPDSSLKPSSEWLTVYHKHHFPHIPSDVSCIVGHVDVTSRAARKIKEERFPHAKLAMFGHMAPEETEHYKSDEKALGVGRKEASIQDDIGKADVVFSVGPRIHRHYDRFLQKEHVTHHIFLPEPSKVFCDANVTFHEDKVRKPKRVVLSIGRVRNVERLKGHDLAAGSIDKAAQRLDNKYTLRLRVRGIDLNKFKESKRILEEKLRSDRVKPTLLPYGTQEEIRQDMEACHLVLMPSRAEPFGLVGLEAIAAGVPVLISEHSGLAELIKELSVRLGQPTFRHCIVKMKGDTVTDDDVEKWAERIEGILKNARSEFAEARAFREKLLASKYWEESHQTFLHACGITDGGTASRQGFSTWSEDVRRHFYFIKENVSTDWRDLAHLLGFTRPDIDAIQYKPTNRDAKDCCMDMLEAWRRRRGDAATLQELLRALTEVGLQDSVDQLNTM